MAYTTTPIGVRVLLNRGSRPTGLLRQADNVLRRLLDFFAALFGLIILSPLFVAVGLIIKRDSEGPIFYRGWRMGKDSRPFRMLKFRTMYERPESYEGPMITAAGDARVTPMGRWLRETKLNELPQLWNVLRGEMSLVGPRPEDPEIAAQWPEATRAELLSVRPGITSPASVLFRDEEALLTASDVVQDYLSGILPDKLRLDLIYVRHRTVLRDLDVIFYTLLLLAPKLRHRHISEHALYWGPLTRFLDRHLSFFLIDLIGALFAVVTAGVIWRQSGPLHIGPLPALIMALAIATGFSTVNVLLGLHCIFWSKAPAITTVDLGLSAGLATMLALAINRVASPIPLPDGLLLVAGLLAYFDFVLFRYRSRLITGLATRWLEWRGSTHRMGERVLIIGAGEGGNLATWLLRHGGLAPGFHIIGMVDDAPYMHGSRINGVRVLGSTSDLPELVSRHDVGVLLFAIATIERPERERIMEICGRTAARLILLPPILENLRAHFHGSKEPGRTRPVLNGAGAEPQTAGQWQQWLGHLDRLIQQQAWDNVEREVQQKSEELRASQSEPPLAVPMTQH